ncbi:MAG TPA: tripartite tricarboxylate transporter substrate binding protein [Bordetella sp.]|nr:tripartite tricarboxylate transporter substrate binding protein [Bordetella sp.]
MHSSLPGRLACRLTLVCAIGAITAFPAGTALAQAAFPSKPIRLLVPFPPGGASDGSARLVAEAMSRQLNQNVIVENRPGAAGLITGEAIARAEPDGYMLMLGYNGLLAVSPFIVQKMPYDTLKDQTAVGKIADYPSVLAANAKVDVRNWKDVLALSKKLPQGLFYGTSGSGSLDNLIGAVLAQSSGAHLVHVPYKGAGPALTDAMGGHIPLSLTSLSGALPYIKAGTLRPIAVSGAERSAFAPDVPTFTQAGVPDNVVITSSIGLIAPSKTPKPVIDVLNKALNTVLATPQLQHGLGELGMTPRPGTPDDYQAEIKRDYDRFGAIVKTAHIQAD